MAAGGLRKQATGNIREIVFGLEDSLVSTLGTVSGIAVGSGQAHVVLLAGMVLVVVEAVSMAAGSYLSSKSSTELYNERVKQDGSRVLHAKISDEETLRDFFARKHFSKQETAIALEAIMRERKLWLNEVRRHEYRLLPAVNEQPYSASLVMGITYLCGGCLVLLPYALLPLNIAFAVALVLAICALFALGVWKGKVTGGSQLRSGLEMLSVSLVAALLGIIIGRIMSEVLPQLGTSL